MPDGRRFNFEIVPDAHDPRYRDVMREAASVFQSPHYIDAAAARLLRKSQSLVLIGVHDDEGRGIALFPFVRLEHRGAIVLQGLDLDVTDYFAPPLRADVRLTPQETAKLWRGVCRALPGIDAVGFKKMPRALFGKVHALSAFAEASPMSVTATHVDVPADPKSDPRLVSVAREVRRKTKKLEQIGPVTFAQEHLPDAAGAFDRLVELRKARFAELGRRDALSRPEVEGFYRGELERPGGLGRLFVLRAGEAVAAAVYCFEYAGTLTMVAPVISNDREVQAGSPGLVAIYRIIEWCAVNGIAMLDLSVGSLAYKGRFSADTTELHEHAQALTPRGFLSVSESAARRHLRRLAISHPWIRTVGERFAA